MLLSIIVPIYNIEKWLTRCVESVLCQKFADYELILVDDGSKDSSGQLCDEYAKANQNIVVIHKENGGLSDARNAGVKVAKGEYLLFLDGDDYLVKDALEYVHSVIESNGKPQIIYSNGNYEFDESGDLQLKNQLSILNENSSTNMDGREFLRSLLNNKIAGWSAWGKVYQREFWEVNGFQYYRRFMEDIDVTYKMYEKADTIAIMRPFYCYYRGRMGSLLTKIKAENLMTYMDVLYDWYEYLEQNDSFDSEIKQLIYNIFAKEYCEAILGKIYYTLKERRDELIKKAVVLNIYLKKANTMQCKVISIIIYCIGYKNTCFLLNIWKRIKNGKNK